MELRATILGLLSWKPASGYDLKRIIADSDLFYWSGNNNQIYRSLLELQKEGLVTHQVELQENLPAKKVYSITEKGLSELTQGLLSEPEAPELHKNFLIQLAWSEILPDEEILNLLEHYEAEITNRLLIYQEQARQSENGPGRSKREKYLWKRIHENLIQSYQIELDWARQTIQEFREGKFLEE